MTTSPKLIQLTIDEDEFDATYPLVENHLRANASWTYGESNGCLFETYGEELDFVRRQPVNTVWTLLDWGEDDQALLSGYHVVNRMGYLISRVPIPDGVEISVPIPHETDHEYLQDDFGEE